MPNKIFLSLYPYFRSTSTTTGPSEHIHNRATMCSYLVLTSFLNGPPASLSFTTSTSTRHSKSVKANIHIVPVIGSPRPFYTIYTFSTSSPFITLLLCTCSQTRKICHTRTRTAGTQCPQHRMHACISIRLVGNKTAEKNTRQREKMRPNTAARGQGNYIDWNRRPFPLSRSSA